MYFSRLPGAHLYIREARVLEALLLLLDHSNLELLHSVCGTLVNMTADRTGRAATVELGGAWRLVEVMERAAVSATTKLQGSEVHILGVVFKLVYNLALKMPHVAILYLHCLCSPWRGLRLSGKYSGCTLHRGT